MGGWNRSRYVRRQPDRSRRPPPRPPPDYGHEHCPVPLWEREFCSYVGNISWQRFCENKQYVSVYNNLEQWNDSGAFENFQNAKARFWSYYHGQPSDIPLSGPDMYIDKVDHRCKVDPELVADLDKVRLPFDSDYSAPATGSGNAEAVNKCTQNESGNWDIYIEKPAEVNKWDWEASLGSKAIWGGNNESSSKWGNGNSGWGAALEKPSWCGWSNERYASNNRNDSFYGGSNNNSYWDEDPSHTSGRKRNSSGYFQQRNNKQRNQDDGHHQRSGWQDHRGRNKDWRPLNKNNRAWE
ncbi:hypothetical protein SETIT_8G026200v2 [Setaria italica]|uniref:Uncharacterized protein n=1 Tax=Setaria italica TaxID=4555 RepID=K3ZJE9_SETIT|nr:uncharacterized protein LOC101765361 [Setaria italica]RCV36989.1 hypothetical protein SETIT_8G026200v2 [Setaria italica]